MSNTKELKLPIYIQRFPLISWLLLPFFILWLSISYLIGLANPTDWQKTAVTQTIASQSTTDKPNSQIAWDKTGLVTLWFDDAWLSQYTVALPLLEKFQMKGALAVPTNMINLDAYMTWPQVEKMQYMGWEIDSHSRSHDCNIKTFSLARIQDEIEGSQEILKRHNIFAQNYVSPCGEMTPQMLTEIKKTYLSLRSTDDGVNDIPVTDPYHINIYALESNTTMQQVNEWIQEAQTDKKWLILVFHQIGDEKDQYEIKKEFFLQILQAVKESNLPIVLPSQALHISL